MLYKEIYGFHIWVKEEVKPKFMLSPNKKILSILFVLVCLVLIGTVGYILIENFSVLDALYMTIITISTVGFREVRHLSDTGKIFTVFFIIAGLGSVAYAFTTIAVFFAEGEFKEILWRRRMKSQILGLKEHYILCGAGQTGLSVIEYFQNSNVDFIVIEKDKEKADELIKQGVLTICGDAINEETLAKSHIYHAKGLITCLSNDADNVFTVLTARSMNEKLHIVSRVIDKKSHAKLRKAGANNTLSPNEIGGFRMAALLLKPVVISFLDIITRAGDTVFDLEEVSICQGSKLLGKNLQNARISEEIGLIVLAIKKRGEKELKLNPDAQEILDEGDKILVIGKIKQINVLRHICCGKYEVEK